jgi:hypothetical protein
MQRNHETVPVRVPAELFGDTDLINIDRRLAGLLPLLWEQGIVTRQRREERWPGLAYISFYGRMPTATRVVLTLRVMGASRAA